MSGQPEQFEDVTFELLVNEAGRLRREPLVKPALVIGRAAPADVVLGNPLVSRKHAKLSRDGLGVWTIEDLASHNGVWIDGQRVSKRTLAPGDHVTIGPFILSIVPAEDAQTDSDSVASFAPSLAEDSAQSELFVTRVDADENISSRRLRELNFITDRLAEITASGDLYREACRRTARQPDETSLILHLQTGEHEDRKPPEILAFHRGGASPTDDKAQAGGFRISRRVIEAVARNPQPVQASNLRFSGSHLQLTLTDDEKPRAVLCVPITVDDDSADVLYLDVPAEQAGTDALDFARAIGRQVNFARKSLLLAEETARRRIIDHQLEMAREIQSNMVPTKLDLSASVDLALLCEPAMWVGGDHCDVWSLADGRIALVVGDVSGKGLPAAMVMTNLQAALRTALDFCPDPAQALTHVSRHLEKHMPLGIFVTLFLGLLHPESGRLNYVNAGHVMPLLASGGKVGELGVPRHMPLGLGGPEYASDTADITPGDAMIIVTDGVTEAKSPNTDDEFGMQRLQSVFEAAPSAASGDLVGAVAQAIQNFRGPLKQHDDVTILALRIRQ
ncbi:MAG: FHA domain-containing protein [Planctomycetaceae bacterium]|nr:MAG: FHA domain-containing protein [Planctomycetaceae bacterium]